MFPKGCGWRRGDIREEHTLHDSGRLAHSVDKVPCVTKLRNRWSLSLGWLNETLEVEVDYLDIIVVITFASFAILPHDMECQAFTTFLVMLIKLKDWEKFIADANSSLEIEPNNNKALFRQRFGRMMQSRDKSNIKEALDDFIQRNTGWCYPRR